MSTGKRLAKRSIIGTRVSARGKDGKYYNGYIHALKSPASATAKDSLNISSDTLYSVRFDIVPGTKPPSPNTEFTGRDLIAPGFESIDSATFVAGQKVYLTYNGREIQAEVTQHRKRLDEVDVIIAPNGQEGNVILTKRIDDLRLSESRKSPRLADQDTDFARLADMGSDRKRSASHSIDVPHVPGSRKRRPSSNYDSERPYGNSGGTNGVVGSGGGGGSWQETTRVPRGCGRVGCPTNDRGDCMDECTAALVLMSLSCSPHSPYNPLPFHCQQNYGSWGDNSVVAGSPGVTSGSSSSNSSSSGASWRTGTPSPPLSDEGAPTVVTTWHQPAYHPPHNQPTSPYTATGSPSGSTPGSSGTWDEGIERDYDDEQMRPRKKTKKCRTKVKRDRVENRRPCTGYNAENREQSSSPKEIKVEMIPVPQRSAPVSQRSTPVPQRQTTVAQRPTSVAQRQSAAAQRTAPVSQRSTPVAQRSVSVAQRSTAAQRSAPAAQRAATTNNGVENREVNSAPGYKFGPNKPVKLQPNLFQCTWPNCTVVKATDEEIEDHVRRQHLEPQKKMELAQGIIKTIVYGDEEFYYQEVEAKNMSSPPTLSHRDMARPPHEDPEYQRQLRLEADAPTAMIVDNNTVTNYGNNNNKMENAPRSASVIRENNSSTLVTFGVSSSQPLQQQSTTVKHMKLSPGQMQVCQQNPGLLTVTTGKTPSPPRRGRGDTKKCRKIYGMEKRELWCTQCKWKKACTRYGN